MMCDALKILCKCFNQANYSLFTNYKDIETFLNLSKDQIDFNSYTNYRKKMVLYC